MRKKLLISLLILILAGSLLYAYDFPEFFNGGRSFRPVSARLEAMGGSGLTAAKGEDALFANPANLASRRFALYLPSVSVTLYNPKAIIDSGFVEELEKSFDDESALPSLMTKLFGTINKGRGELLTTDIATSFHLLGFGLGLQVQEQLHTTSSKGNIATAKLIAEINAAATVGFGYRIKVMKSLSVDVGVSSRFTYKGFSDAFGASYFVSLLSDEDEDPLQKFMEDRPIAFGWAVPIDVGVNVNLPLGFKVAMVARDLNATYYMKNYEHSGQWANEMGASIGLDEPYEGVAGAVTEFEYTVPWSLDLGLGWSPSLGGLGKIIRPTLSVDFININGIVEELEEDQNAFLRHMNVGAEVSLFSMVDLRAGLNTGYMSVGVGLNLFAVKLDAAYYWREFGKEIGDKPMDAFTIRVNIGWPK